MRETPNASFYIANSGRAWRLLLHDFYPGRPSSLLQDLAHRDGRWERLIAALREHLRMRLRRNPHPSRQEWSIYSRPSRLQRAVRRADTTAGEGGRQKAPFTRRYVGISAQSQGTCCQHHGLGRDQDAAAPGRRAVPRAQASVAGQRFYRGEDKERLGREGSRVQSGARQASVQASPRRSPEVVGLKQWTKEGMKVDWFRRYCWGSRHKCYGTA